MERNYSFDKMRFYCIVAIVCIHTLPFKGTKFGWIINTLCRNAVPLFFICSGYWFYTKFSSDYAKKHFLKISKMFLCWSMFYAASNICMIYFLKDNPNLFTIIKEVFVDFSILNIYYCYGIISFHLWYLMATLVVMPILYVVIKNNLISKVLIVSLILNIAGVFLYNFNIDWIITTRDGLFLGLFYMTLGAYIKSKEDIIINKLKSMENNYVYIIFMFIIMSFLERYIYETYFFQISDYLISTIPLSFLLFTLFMLKTDNKDNFLSKIGRNSVGIYIIHIFFMDILNFALFKSNLVYIKKSIPFQFLYTPALILISYLSYISFIYLKNNFIKVNK